MLLAQRLAQASLNVTRSSKSTTSLTGGLEAGKGKRPPAIALEFVLSLEATQRTVDGLKDLPHSSIELEIWYHKVKSYAEALQTQLDAWSKTNTLEVAELEHYKSRIEYMVGTMEQMLAKAQEPIVTPVSEPALSPNINLETKNARSASRDENQVISSTDPERRAAERSELATAVEQGTGLLAVAENQATVARAKAVTGASWRPSGKAKVKGRVPTKPTHAARDGIQNDMLDLAEGMKGAANKFQKTIQKDNARLNEISDMQQTNLDSVTAANTQGKQMLRSGNMSFFCTMILVAISVVIFFSMIPFIIIT